MPIIKEIAEKNSNFAKLREIRIENVGRLLYVRLEITTGNAAGHNMVTEMADTILDFIISNHKGVKYVSVSGNCCCDKKVSSVNGILGRGKRVSAEITVPRDVCVSILKANPVEIVALNVKKNLVGSILAGGVRSGNAHYANVMLGIYLATGQDAANLVEASQGITFADLDGDDLYFSVNIPNIIVGTVGNGKELEFASENLKRMGCDPDDPNSAKKLAAIIASAVLCSELSLMAALTNRGELMASHLKLERHCK
jgi:hydroxymethylglutaryl-CoA reductase (NADPH)